MLGIRVPANRPPQEVIDVVRHADSVGFDAAWLPDSQLNYREVWTTLGALAVSTERIQIGPSVTNVVSRHPTVTASAARTLHELAPDRVILGLGSGDSTVGFDRLLPAKPDELKRGALAIRSLLHGELVSYGKFHATLRDASANIPIYVAGSGPKVLAAAGEVADGVIILPGRVKEKMALVRDAAARANRHPPPVFLYVMAEVTDDIEALSRNVKPIVLRNAQLEGTGPYDERGLAISVPEHVAGADGDAGHAEDYAAASRQLDEFVSDEAALWFAQNRMLVGSKTAIKARVDHWRSLGIAGVTVSQISGSELPWRLVDSLGFLTEQRVGCPNPRLPQEMIAE